ncbi:MAG TPA: amidohydrolase [Sneathiellales bacterium]|nr:amidohydrolase [Sneathiellales bacterium]
MGDERDPSGGHLPIKLDATSNGEFLPRPLSAAANHANALAADRTEAAAHRVRLPRRRFLASACGAADTLLAMNDAFATIGKAGGFYDLPSDAAFDPQLAANTVGGAEFIFDIQGHHVNPAGKWRDALISPWNMGLRFFPQAKCENEDDAIECFSAENFIKEVFLDSDTDICVLSQVPASPEKSPLHTAEAAATRAMVNAMDGDHRLMIHGIVRPQLPGGLDAMDAQLADHNIAAWKTYTQWGPNDTGFWLHSETYGLPMIERARKLGVKVICVHKGLPLPGLLFGVDDSKYARPRDIGVVARLYPDMTFIVYHSGFEPDHPEGPYDPDDPEPIGINDLVRSLHDNGIPPNSNVYAELGSTWRYLMRDPTQAAHLIGKLLKYVGEDRVLWGTDSIWYGSPQDQIQAFRTFQISKDFRDKYGYPKMTPEIRAKVFGLNAAGPYGLAPEDIRKRNSGDRVDTEKKSYREKPNPSFTTYGPRNRSEFLSLVRAQGNRIRP